MTPPVNGSVAASPMGGGVADHDRRHPFPGGQARASGKTGARLADTGRSGADDIRYAGGNGDGLPTRRRSICDSRDLSSPSAVAGATASVEGAWFMYTRRRP